jgi:hypothetical protein
MTAVTPVNDQLQLLAVPMRLHPFYKRTQNLTLLFPLQVIPLG